MRLCDAKATGRAARDVAAAHVVAGNDERAVGGTKPRKRLHEHVDALPRGELAEIRDERAADAEPLAELFRAGGGSNSSRRSGLGDDADAVRRHTNLRQLLPLGLGDRKNSGGTVHHAPADGSIEQPLGCAAPFDVRRGAVRGEHVRHAGRSQMARGDDAGQISAGVQMRDIERPCACRLR